MEVALQEESSPWTGASPRISFSHDLSPVDADEDHARRRRLDLSLPLDTASVDFDFSLGADASSHDPSPADDLFSGGKLLPLPIKAASSSSSSPPPPHSAAAAADPPASLPGARGVRKRGSLREVMASGEEGADAGGGVLTGRLSLSKAVFRRFRRSSSLNYGGGGSLFSLPLLRSKSSGASSPMQIRSSVKQCRSATTATASTELLLRRGYGSSESKTTPARVYYYSAAAAGNSRRGSHGNAVRISPVLHVPTPTGMGILSFLLCKRGDKSMANSSAVVCSP